MSHDIFLNQNGVYSAAFAVDKKGLPWHALGQMVNGAMTWQEAMEKACLDWEVAKHKLYMKNPMYDGNGGLRGFQVPAAYAVCRSDIEGENSVLGIVGEQYQPIQNKTMFSFVDNLLESAGAHYESAGVLGKGEKVWCLARVPHCDYSIGNDKHEMYLLFASSHDGSMAGIIQLTDVRVVCNNTLSAAINHGTYNQLKVRHTKSASDKMESIKKLWSGVEQNVNTLKDKFNKLLEKKATKEVFSNTMKRLFGNDWQDSTRKQNNALEIARIFDENDNNAFPEQKGTAYNLINAVTNYVDHSRTARITINSGYNTTDQARADSSLVGSGASMKEKALDVILEQIETEPVMNNAHAQVQIKDHSIDRILEKVAF